MKDRRVRRVDVLRRLLVVLEQASAETDRAIAQIVDRNHQAATKHIVGLLGPLTRFDQASFQQHFVAHLVDRRRISQRSP